MMKAAISKRLKQNAKTMRPNKRDDYLQANNGENAMMQAPSTVSGGGPIGGS